MKGTGQEQLFFDLEGPPQFRRRDVGWLRMEGLYFAIIPEPKIASRAIDLAEKLCDRHKLSGKLYRPELLHISLTAIGAFHELPEDIIFAAMQAAATITAAPITVTFDRVMSFAGRDNHALVLGCSTGSAELRALYDALGSAIGHVGLTPNLRPGFVPHMTLLRNRAPVSEIILDEPISWVVLDFVLVHSLLGRSKHEHLGRWPLLGGRD